MATGLFSESPVRAQRSVAACLGVSFLVAVLSLSAVVASQDQPESDSNMVVPASRHNDARQAQRTQVEEHNDKPASIDHLLEEAFMPSHLSWEDADTGGCARGMYLTELDQCLTHEQLTHLLPVMQPNTVSDKAAGGKRQKRQIHRLVFSLWRGAVVPYVFHSSFPTQDRQLVLSAMAEWERVTCIRFRPAKPDDRDLVILRDGQRCSTNIGRVGGRQLMTLAQPCRRKRILIHELGHVLGLIHEHQRQDRDNYVTVMLHNVRNSSQERYQFSKLAPSPVTDGQVKYSYTSIMHYGKNYFARSPDLTTLRTNDPHFQDVIGRAEVPAVSDAEAVTLMYGCGATTQNRLPDATCEMFKRTGECEGHNKETIRPLCLRSCQLRHQGLQSHVGAFQPIRTTPRVSSTLRKTHVPFWDQSANVIGQTLGLRIADTLISPITTFSGPGHQPSRAAPSLKRASTLFGNIPRGQSSSLLSLRRQQQDRQQHLQRRLSSAGVSKWIPPTTKARATTWPFGSTRGAIHFRLVPGPNQLPVWLRSRAQAPTRLPQRQKAAQAPWQKTATVEREPAAEGGGAREVSMAAHNMKALSPEALPESPVRPSARVSQGAPSFHHQQQQQDRVRYSYDTPQHLGLLQSMLSQTLPSESPQQGAHTRRPVHRPPYTHSLPHSQSQLPPAHTHTHTHSNSHPYSHDQNSPPSPYTSVQIQSAYHSAHQPPTSPPATVGGLLETNRNDGWGAQGSPGSAHAQNFGALPAHSPEGWSIRAEQARREGGFQAFRDSNSHSRGSGPVMHPLGSSLGPDSQRYFVT